MVRTTKKVGNRWPTYPELRGKSWDSRKRTHVYVHHERTSVRITSHAFCALWTNKSVKFFVYSRSSTDDYSFTPCWSVHTMIGGRTLRSRDHLWHVRISSAVEHDFSVVKLYWPRKIRVGHIINLAVFFSSQFCFSTEIDDDGRHDGFRVDVIILVPTTEVRTWREIKCGWKYIRLWYLNSRFNDRTIESSLFFFHRFVNSIL